MKANPRRIHDIFGHTVRYTVPLFQRPYVWDRELRRNPSRSSRYSEMSSPSSFADWMPGEGTKPEDLDLIVHTIGNLSLVNDKLNPAMSNGAWETKRDKLVENSLLRLNRYFASRETWKEQDILERGTKLAEAAEKVWPHPQDLK